MLSNAYTLYDCKSLTYSPPFYYPAHGQAVRTVMDLASDPNTMVGRHPADFTLFCIGRFDDALGRLLSADVREHIADCISLVPRPTGDLFTRSEDGRTYTPRSEAENFEQPAVHPLTPAK